MSKEKKKSGLWVITNLLGAAVFVCVVLFAVNKGLKIFTEHNDSVEVPDLIGKSLPAANLIAQQNKLELILIDSVFVSRFKQGAVYAQNPKPGASVKKGRKIYLTINARRTRRVAMPNLVGLSVRQAKVELLSENLVLGRLNYVQDMATNNVLGQSIKGVSVPADSMVKVGSVVDLKVGLNPRDAHTIIPRFISLPYHKAVNAVQDSYLNIDELVFDQTVKSYSDSIAAVVYKQIPDPSDNRVTKGKGVKLYLTLDLNKVPKEPVDSLETDLL